MSMISEQVRLLREVASDYERMNMDICTQRVLREAADTIETLSEKVRANNLHGGWIPVSEKLPNKEGSYLITSETGAVTTAHWYMPSEWKPDGFWGRVGKKKTVAWMELPKPYKEGENSADE